MDTQQEYITAEKKKALEVELNTLQTTKRNEVLAALDFAKSLGDLSENSEYHQAREDQAKLEDRIRQVEHILKNSVVVERHHANTAEVGATVTVLREGTKDKKVYQLVGSEEANMDFGKISYKSPIGEALIGKKKGDSTTVHTPKGAVEYKVLDIE